MTNDNAKKIEDFLDEADKSKNEQKTIDIKKMFLDKGSLLRKRIDKIVAIEEKLYGKMAKTRRLVSALIGVASGYFTGTEFMEMYNSFYDTNLMSLYNLNNAELNQMKVDLLTAGVAPEDIHLPVFSDSVREILAELGVDANASSSQVILDAMSKGAYDISTLDVSTGFVVAILVVLSGIFAGFETNNFFKNRIREQEGKKIAAGELPTFIEKEKQSEKDKEQKSQEKDELEL